jgi:hypothetical protein
VFPGLPGCTSGGDGLQEAARNAPEALAFHIEGMLEAVPEPGTLDDPLPDWLADEDLRRTVRLLVPVDLPGRALRLNVSLEEGPVRRIDAAAAVRGMSRSAFLAEAARRALAGAWLADPRAGDPGRHEPAAALRLHWRLRENSRCRPAMGMIGR